MEEYLDELEALLLEREEAMLLSQADGFVSGILVSPDPIALADALPYIWDAAHDPADASTQRRLLDLLTRHHAETAAALAGPDLFVPLFDTDERNGDTLWEVWIDGFATAMRLAPHGWNRLRRSTDPSAEAAIAGLTRLIWILDDDPELDEEEAGRWADQAPALIPSWIQTLYDWREDATRNAKPGKIGRNDPCSCGSGKKYKKCCAVA